MGTKKILIAGSGFSGSDLMLQTMRERHGDNIQLVTPEDIKEQGINIEEIYNPPIKIKASPFVEDYMFADDIKSGQERRREKRKKQRNPNK